MCIHVPSDETALLWSSLSYTAESAGAPIGLNVSLAIDAPLTAGDVLVLTLPGYATYSERLTNNNYIHILRRV
jgi:type IV secretory pathway protease TraF